MEELSLVLWRERELLETLLFKLESEQLVLASGRPRWVGRASDEVAEAVQRIRETEVLRVDAAARAAARLGLPVDSSLSALVDAATEPWKSILADHRSAFLQLTADVAALAERNRELITSGYRAAREAMLGLEGEGAAGYTPDGEAVAVAPRPSFVDRSL